MRLNFEWTKSSICRSLIHLFTGSSVCIGSHVCIAQTCCAFAWPFYTHHSLVGSNRQWPSGLLLNLYWSKLIKLAFHMNRLTAYQRFVEYSLLYRIAIEMSLIPDDKQKRSKHQQKQLLKRLEKILNFSFKCESMCACVRACVCIRACRKRSSKCERRDKRILRLCDFTCKWSNIIVSLVFCHSIAVDIVSRSPARLF